jgi:hypothetical protein
MGLLVRVIVAAAGVIAALIVERDALNFPVIEGVIAVLLIVAAVFAFAWLTRRR